VRTVAGLRQFLRAVSYAAATWDEMENLDRVNA
jgi:hypothetical protein